MHKETERMSMPQKKNIYITEVIMSRCREKSHWVAHNRVIKGFVNHFVGLIPSNTKAKNTIEYTNESATLWYSTQTVTKHLLLALDN